MGKNLYHSQLDEHVKLAKQECKANDATALRAILFLDLCDSAAAKIEQGHTLGTEAAIFHNALGTKITKAFDGSVFKEVGDGVLCEFPDPLKACIAALNFKKACSIATPAIRSKAAITLGMVQPQENGDFIGTTIDRCARILSFALPNQILIENAVYNTIKSMLTDYPEIEVSTPAKAELKGCGQSEIMELTTSDFGYAIETEHFGGTISPVMTLSFPSFTEPASHLICETCKGEISHDGTDAIVVIEEDATSIIAIHLSHKGKCEKFNDCPGWREMHEFSNPAAYVQFITSILNDLVNNKKSLKDARGLVNLMFGMYRQVFRTSSAKEQLDFVLDYKLRKMGM